MRWGSPAFTHGYRPISTRAITIDAPPGEVWPWVERLLFITYADGHSSVRIHPEWQELYVGDKVPYSRFNMVEVTMVDRPRCLIAGEWLVLELLHHYMETGMLQGIKARVEASHAGRQPILHP